MSEAPTPTPARDASPPGAALEAELNDQWYFAERSANLAAGAQFRMLSMGQPVVIGRTRLGEVFALRDICPHRLVQLSAGRQIDTNGQPTLECPYHGWRFDTSGTCRLMPSLTDDDPTDPTRVKVRNYPVREQHGAIFVYIAETSRSGGIPDSDPPDLGRLSDTPKQIFKQPVDLPMNAAVKVYCGAGQPPLLPTHWTWHPLASEGRQSSRFKRFFGPVISSESNIMAPGFRWESIASRQARLVTLTCLTPIDANTTQVTGLAWRMGAPLMNWMISPGTPAGIDANQMTV